MPITSHCQNIQEYLKAVNIPYLFIPCALMIILVFLICPVWAQDSSEERFYLRYQGMIEGGVTDLSNSIDCVFEFLDSNDIAQHRERHANVLVINNSFTVTLGSGDNPINPSLFSTPVELLTQCDLDRNGDYDVITIEEIGATPRAAVALSVKGSVDASYIRVNGTEVVSPDGEWLGSVITDEEMRAESIEVTSARVTDLLTVPTGHFDHLVLRSLSHHPTVDSDLEIPLISENGAWVGPIEFSDLDNDGVSDWIETLLGSDPISANDTPADLDEDGIFDIFQRNDEGSSSTEVVLPFDPHTFSHQFLLSQSAQVFTSETTPGVTWTAATLEVTQSGPIDDLSINFTLNHPSGVHLVDVQLILPNGDQVNLITHDPNQIPAVIESERTYNFSVLTPPDGVDWETITQLADEARPLQGLWRLNLTNYAIDNTSPNLNSFSIDAEYTSSDMVTLNRNIDLRNTIALSGLPDPILERDAVTKAYVDQKEADLTDSFQQLQATLDPSTPSRVTYRYRTFEVYDVATNSYFFPNLPELFGGLSSSDWGNGAVTAAQVNLNSLDALLTEEKQSGSNALVLNQNFDQSNDLQGLFAIVHLQIENQTENIISWIISPHFSCDNLRPNAHQMTSVGLNGVNLFTSENLTCNSLSTTATISVDLPPNQVSDVIFVVSASVPNNLNQRRLMLAFTNDDLGNLPAGLIYRKLW
jgi:hypothetical protein